MGFCHVRVLPSSLKHFLSNMYVDLSLFEKGHHISLNWWSCTWKVRFHELKVEMPLAMECSTTWVTVKKSVILHRGAGGVLFAARPVGNRSNVR